jgi:hypothetical protein
MPRPYAPEPPPASYPLPQTGWEVLAADYRNVRGLNYVPVYPELFAHPPDLPAPLQFMGAASPTATWRFYQSRDVDRQLGWLRGLGCNAVRVFLSHAVWEHEERVKAPFGENRFLARFADLVRLCEKHRMYLMPVLWNEFSPFGLDPGPDPYDDVELWVRSPGSANTNEKWFVEHRAEDFVRGLCDIARDSRAVFMWDVMNEPNPFAQHDWLVSNIRLLRDLDPNPAHAITVGFAAYPALARNPVVAEPALDVVTYHPYGVFRENIAEWTRLARLSARPPIADRIKPVLASEGGAPTLLARYEDFFRQIRGEGVGFLSWVAVIDDLRGRLPFDNGTGIVFSDGTVRDLPAAEALQQHARADGVLPRDLRPIRFKYDQAGWQVESPFAPGYGIADAVADLHPQAWPLRPRLRDDNFLTDGYLRQSQQLENVNTWGLRILAGAGIGRQVLTADEESTIARYDSEFTARDIFRAPPSQWWIEQNPPRVDWERYTAFFTEWGRELWRIVARHGFAP